MPKVTIIDTPFVSLWYHPDTKIVHHQIKQFISGDPFKELLMAGAELIRTHRAEKWLSDDRGCPVLRSEDTDWSQIHWFPQTALAGFKYWAIVQPTKTVGQVILKTLAGQMAEYGVISRAFTDPDEALRWLETQ